MCIFFMKELSLIILLLFSISVKAQHQDSLLENDNSTFTLQINQDNSFGFFPMVFGTMPFKEVDLTFYSVFWSSPIFANPDGSGSLIETGMGVGFSQANWYLNPSLGFTHGIFTNSRDTNGNGRAVVCESIVPSITVYFKNEKLESEFFTAWYCNLREEGSPQTNYLFVWFLPGIIFNKYISSGLHYEQFRNTSDEVAFYERYGLYFKTTFREKYAIRFSAGLNYTPEGNAKNQGDFYKLTVNLLL